MHYVPNPVSAGNYELVPEGMTRRGEVGGGGNGRESGRPKTEVD